MIDTPSPDAPTEPSKGDNGLTQAARSLLTELQSIMLGDEATPDPEAMSAICVALDRFRTPAARKGAQQTITYHVVAYDESYGGYGDDASRDFKDEASAVAYASKLRSGVHPGGPRYEPIRVFKRITTSPISIEIPFGEAP